MSSHPQTRKLVILSVVLALVVLGLLMAIAFAKKRERFESVVLKDGTILQLAGVAVRQK